MGQLSLSPFSHSGRYRSVGCRICRVLLFGPVSTWCRTLSSQTSGPTHTSTVLWLFYIVLHSNRRSTDEYLVNHRNIVFRQMLVMQLVYSLNIYNIHWTRPMSWLLIMMTSPNGNIVCITCLCEGNPPVTGNLSQRLVTRSFAVFYLPEQTFEWAIETPVICGAIALIITPL